VDKPTGAHTDYRGMHTQNQRPEASKEEAASAKPHHSIISPRKFAPDTCKGHVCARECVCVLRVCGQGCAHLRVCMLALYARLLTIL